MSQFADMKIAGLKLELRKHHLQVSGNKAVLLKRLTDFLRPIPPAEEKQDEEKRPERPERLKQSQRQTINIYTDGKVDKTHSDAKNIYIEPSYAFPPKPVLPSGYNPFMSTATSTSSSSGLKPTDRIYPMPQRPTSAILQESIPLPQNVNLPTPTYNEDEDLKKTIASFKKMLDEKDEDEGDENEGDEEKDEVDDEGDIKELIESRRIFEEKLAKQNEEKINEDDEMVQYRQRVPEDPEYPFGVIKKKNIKKK